MKLTDIIINAMPYLSEFNYDCYTNNYKKFSEDLVPVLSTALLSEVHTAVQDLTDGFDIYYSSLSKKEEKINLLNSNRSLPFSSHRSVLRKAENMSILQESLTKFGIKSIRKMSII